MNHAKELHRQTVEEIKKQSAREMSSLQDLHAKQLEALRAQSNDSNALASTLQKIQVLHLLDWCFGCAWLGTSQ